MIRVADYVMKALYENGIGHVFMVTGRGALFLTDALAANKEIGSVCCHHEQAAAFAAVSYAQYTGKLGACLVSTGCAGTNAMTGVLNAWQDGVPCVFISGQNKLKETSRYTGVKVRTYGQQEADIIPLVEPITKYATMLTDPKKAVYEVEKALYLAKEGRKGPVWIDIPLDVQNMRIRPDELEHFVINDTLGGGPKPEDVEYTFQALSEAKRPVVMIGSGIHSADAEKNLKEFVEKLSIPVTFSASSPDTYGTVNSLSIGSVGAMGCSRAGNFAVQNSDLLLVLGCRMSSMTTGPEFCKFAREANIVIVDIDPVEHAKEGVKIDRLVIADIKQFLLSLINRQGLDKVSREWRDKCFHWKRVFSKCEDRYKSNDKVDLYDLAEALSSALPERSTLLTDSGLIELILPANVDFGENQRCIHPASQGAMGVALAALVGVHYASDQPVITVVGDGSIMMNLQELETISYNNIPAKIFVINNNAYAVIRKRQVELFASRTIGTDPGNGVGCPDFKKVASAFDVKYSCIENAENLSQKLAEVMAMDGPVLCEIMGLEDQGYIHCSHTRNSKRKIVHRPLEDQSPYLDRDVFLSEMIVDPIDQ